MTVPPIRGTALGCAVLAGLIAFAAYLKTLHWSLPTGDSGELISAAFSLGVAHPPGYPLYTLIGHAATLLRVGSPAQAMNFLSALLDAVTVGVVFILIYRLVAPSANVEEQHRNSRRALVAAGTGSLLLAFSTVFWMYSEVAEVFALNNLFAALLLLAALEWERHPGARLLYVIAFLFGLAFTNQQTIVLLAPAFLVLGWSGLAKIRGAANGTHDKVHGLRTSDFAIAAVLFIAGLLPYAYLPIAAAQDPLVNWGDPQTLDRFLAVVSRANYGTLQLGAGDQHGSIVEHLGLLAANLASGFVLAGIALALLGLLWTTRNRPIAGLALAVVFAFSGPLFVAYANLYIADALTKGVLERFYILPSIPVAVLAGAGAMQVLTSADRMRWPAVRSNAVTAALAVVLLALPLGSAAAHVATVDQSGNEVALHYAEDILEPLEPDALLLARSDENYTSLLYAQIVAGFRPDVVMLDVELLKLASTVQQVRRQHPAIVVPWEAYDGGRRTSLSQLVAANIDQRPIYYVGIMEEQPFASGFDQLRAGFARRLLPKGEAPDSFQLLREQAPKFASLHYPNRSYPDTTWEALIAHGYGLLASDVGFAVQSGGAVGDRALAEQMYRTAIRLAPDLPAVYKNLGVLLRDEGRDPKEIVDVWETFLRLSPDDPAADAIRLEIARLKGGP